MAENITGMANVLRNLNKEVEKIKTASRKGIIKSGLLVLRESVKTGVIPVDTGNLKASAFVEWTKGIYSSTASGNISQSPPQPVTGNISTSAAADLKNSINRTVNAVKANVKDDAKSFSVGVAFGAHYSLQVHEEIKNYKEGGPKFLENAIKNNQSKILSIIAEEAKIK